MKKIISLLLLICVFVSSAVMLTSCDEEALRELTNKQWQAAVESNNFNNVTITAEGEIEGGVPATQVVKITEGAVYREFTVDYAGQEKTQSIYFEGQEAINQKNMFLQVFFALISNKDNFEYDEKNDQYVAPSDVTTTVYPNGEAGGIRDVVVMKKNSVVKFDKNYNLSYFACDMTETVYYEGVEEPDTASNSLVWTITDYGKTVISAEEKAAGSVQN